MSNLDDLLKKKWYFQGFNAAPSLTCGPAFSMVRDMPELLGFGYSACIEYFEKDVCYYLYAWDDLYAILDQLLERYNKDSGYLDYLLKEDQRICSEVLAEYKQIGDKDWKNLDVTELFSLWRRADRLYARLLSVSHIVEGFTLTTEDRIRKLAQDKFGDDYLDKLLSLAIARRHSYMTTEYYGLCLIARIVREAGGWNLDANQKIARHQKRYYWKLNSYTSAKVLSVEDFKKEVEVILAKNFSVDKVIADYESLPERLKTKETLIMSIKNRELLTLLSINDAIAIIHDRRKEYITQVIHYLDFLLAEIGKRFHLPLSDLRYIRADELEQLPSIAEELRLRRERSLYIILPGDKSALLIGNEAEKYFKALERTEVEHKSNTVLRGSCASPGKVTGIVKICRGEKELGKVGEGDILVACMTQPEFLPAVRKAKAVITDEGGLTCHAAIVSRELGIPCVIGTKIATKVLKDGDMVEVDANHGVITIIKK